MGVAAVHTVSLEEPEPPIPDPDDDRGYSPTYPAPGDPNAPPPFRSVVSAAVIARGGLERVDYCKVDICGAEATSEEELINLMRLLHQFVNAKHLHLETWNHLASAQAWTMTLRHLEMRGCLPDNETGAIGAMSRILEHALNLEVISLAFHPQEHDSESEVYMPREEKLLDAHHLSYSPHSVLAAAATSAMIPCCLRSRVREINLVHYQGGTAQRALAKFLLCNAPAVDKLWCEFAEGPMFEQIQLMREIKGWLINKAADTHFA
ncbi:hypothetical protein HU200_024791 [Digitaria exilis]|uniref:FBD domain-containing protein n=1 Tax=Digitaria exilis TaxID=1010633 RepID=A0A835EY89_9POAL|nr:hypothetical protein HU200_024791 [Digitaria exilis]